MSLRAETLSILFDQESREQAKTAAILVIGALAGGTVYALFVDAVTKPWTNPQERLREERRRPRKLPGVSLAVSEDTARAVHPAQGQISRHGQRNEDLRTIEAMMAVTASRETNLPDSRTCAEPVVRPIGEPVDVEWLTEFLRGKTGLRPEEEPEG